MRRSYSSQAAFLSSAGMDILLRVSHATSPCVSLLLLGNVDSYAVNSC